MDVICPGQDIESVLGEINKYVSRTTETERLKFWLTREWQKRLRLPDVTVQELGIEIPCNSWNPGPSSDILYGAWWLTAGDMDFV